jgi:DNA-binding cell septation regulator SpoVG
MSAPVEVLEVRRVDAGSLKAFAKVKLGCIVLHGCRVVQQDGQKAWVALPQTPLRKRADGSGGGWMAVVEITNRQVMDQLRDAVLEAWQAGEDQPARAPLPFRGQRTWDRVRNADRNKASAAGEALLAHAPPRRD